MDHFARGDVEAIVSLLSRGGDPTVEWSVTERKRYLLEGTAAIVGAEIWLWSVSAVNPEVPGDAMLSWSIDGGWESDTQRVWFFQFLTDPSMSAKANMRGIESHHSQVHRTLARDDMYDRKEDIAELLAAWNAHGFGDFLLSIYPISKDISSTTAVYRRTGQPDFTEREKAIVHLIFHQVDWLHRDGLNVPAGNTVIHLTPRERQVLIFLLGGDSQKEVAKKLGISPHTVNDYVKNIYRQLNVTTRPELMALFISGGARC